MAVEPSHMPLHLLESMTDNFSEDRVRGSGAYGTVYLGEQKDGRKIAIKILHDKPGLDKVQFEKEFYNLANLQHQNIVRLVGFCHETRRELWTHNEERVLAKVTRKALCFEFMENGSLDSYIFDESNGHGWRTRYAIIKGVCNGLKYLHEEVKPHMLHLDLKPANILLDKNMIPKIADFGLSRFFKEDKSHITNSPIGTLGYLPPEFINEKLISKKLDIFSLGVVIIKIMAGPEGHSRSAEITSEKFIENVHGNWRNRLQSAASGDLLESYSEQVKICMEIALSCLETDRQKRPTIRDVVNMLTETETLENYQGALIDQIWDLRTQTCIREIKGLQEPCRDGSEDARILQLSEIIVTEMRAAAVPLPPAPQIYRVPEVLLAADKGAYQPTFMPLGPYHRGDSDSATEEMRRNDAGKPRNMACAMEMAGGGRPVVEYTKAIASIESEARSCYDSDVTMGWDAFCRMLLLDGFQLITLLGFLGSNDDEPPEETAGGDADGLKPSIEHDLMMLENQIPFFVVQRMYALLHADAGSGAIVKLAWGTISNIMGGLPAASNPPPPEFQHLVHLCHIYLQPSNLEESLGPCGDYGGRFRRATEYYEAGVRFRRLDNEQVPLLDVRFLNGVLRMAHHRVDEKTNYILRNVLVYEQRYIRTATRRDTGYVTAYVVFMSQLLGSPEDVALLSRRGVIEHHLGNDAEVCALFRGLAEGLIFDPSSKHYLNAVGVKLGAYCRSRLNQWGAWVLRHRLGNP